MSTMWRPCGRRAESNILTRLKPRWRPRKPAPMQSPFTCARIAATSWIATCSALLRRSRFEINQELAPTEEMVEIALKVKPDEVCFVPERREELTTEGGLDVVALSERIIPLIKRLREARIGVSLFVEPDQKQLAAAKSVGAQFVELHTGTYASLADQDLGEPKRRRNYELGEQAQTELQRIRDGAKAARALGLKVNAGHGLNYVNVGPVASITGLQWLHIGHAIVARAVMVGMAPAVREMKTLIALAGPAKAIARPGKVLRK